MSGTVSRTPLAFRRQSFPASRDAARSAVPATTEKVKAEEGRLPSDIEQRAAEAMRNTPVHQAATGGLFILAGLFLVSLLFPTRIYIFGLMFQPYKIGLTILFIPLLVMLFKGRAGKPMLVDWLMIGSTLWVLLAMVKNNGMNVMVITGGSYVVEFLGAYLLARIAIRSGSDFQRMVKVLFILILVLLPFTALEAFTRVPVLAQLIGADWMTVNIGARLGMRRAQVVFEHPILFGAFVSTAFGLVWYALIPNASFVARMFLVSFVGTATIFSLSTGAFLAVIVQIGLIFWELTTRPRPNRWRIFAWLVVIGYLALDQVTTRTPFHTLVQYAAFNSQSSYNRILIFEFGMQNVKANPIFGIGFKEWARPRWMGASVDNFWLLTAMRFGIPALLMFAGAILLIIRNASRQTMIDPLDRACRAAYLTALGGLIISAGTVHYWRAIFVFVIFIIGSGVWMFTGGARSPSASTSNDAKPHEIPKMGRLRKPQEADDIVRGSIVSPEVRAKVRGTPRAT